MDKTKLNNPLFSFMLGFAWAWPMVVFVYEFIESGYQIIRTDLLMYGSMVAVMLDRRREERDNEEIKRDN